MKKSPAEARRILVLEDEPAIGGICQRVLAGEEFEVDIAVNGKIAQDMLMKKPYDLCLLDIKTPAMSGKEFYQWLEKTHPQLLNKVIFTTGNVMGGDTMIFIEQTGKPFLPKPFTPDELKAVVRDALKEAEI